MDTRKRISHVQLAEFPLVLALTLVPIAAWGVQVFDDGQTHNFAGNDPSGADVFDSTGEIQPSSTSCRAQHSA